MTLVRPTSEDREPDALRQFLPAHADAPAKVDFPTHPTLVEIAQRRKEIQAWEALSAGGYRFAKPATIVSIAVCAVNVLLALTPIPPNWPWNIPLLILGVFAAVATVVCGLLWFDNPDIGTRPELLKIMSFSRAENLHLMSSQADEPYCATCTCPGCGDFATHLVRRTANGEPEWAAVTRQCRVCDRQWAQS